MELTIVASPLLGAWQPAPAALRSRQINNPRVDTAVFARNNNKQLNEEN
jgi:hypothetical protein